MGLVDVLRASNFAFDKPMSDAEIAAFQQTLPCALPADIRELLRFCRGFEGDGIDFVDFSGRRCQFAHEEVFPHGLPFAADGLGNFWVVDLMPDSTSWGPIYFACHDAPVILYQGPTLEHFITELQKANEPPHKSAVEDVHGDRLFRVWQRNPGVKTQAECLRSSDPVLSAFARELDPAFQIVDMRNAEVGFGFSWGRYGHETVIRRFGTLPVFGYRKP